MPENELIYLACIAILIIVILKQNRENSIYESVTNRRFIKLAMGELVISHKSESGLTTIILTPVSTNDLTKNQVKLL
jgi:hypothetical protein